jgi:hypothetical protein
LFILSLYLCFLSFVLLSSLFVCFLSSFISSLYFFHSLSFSPISSLFFRWFLLFVSFHYSFPLIHTLCFDGFHSWQPCTMPVGQLCVSCCCYDMQPAVRFSVTLASSRSPENH